METKKEKNKCEQEKFTLTDKSRTNGYFGEIPKEVNSKQKDLILIDFERDFENKRKSRFASTGTIQNGEFVSDNADFITGITEYQLFILVHAGVIRLKKAQREFYKSALNKIYTKKEDEY